MQTKFIFVTGGVMSGLGKVPGDAHAMAQGADTIGGDSVILAQTHCAPFVAIPGVDGAAGRDKGTGR